LTEIPRLVQIARDNLEEATRAVATAEGDTARTAADKRMAKSLELLAVTNDSLAKAQHAGWSTRLTEEERKSLQTYCDLGGAPETWELKGLPSRALVKRAAEFPIIYNPDQAMLASGVAGFFGITESFIVNGVARFLVDRAAVEIQLAFIDRVKKDACDAKRRPVFESTCNALDQTQLVLHASVMRELRSAAEQDLRRLPRTAPLAVIITDSTFKANFGKPNQTSKQNQQQDFLLTAYLIGAVLEQLAGGSDPLEALAGALDRDRGVLATSDAGGLFVAALSRNDTVSLPVSAGLHRLALVARMLPDQELDGRPDWPADADGRRIFIKTVAVNLHPWIHELGLAKVLQPDSVVALATVLSGQVSETRERAEAIRKRLATLKADDVAALPDVAQLIDDGLALAESWASLLEDLQPRDSALVRSIREFRLVATGFAQRDYARATLGLYALANRSGRLEFKIPEGTVQVLSFVSAAAQAESSEQFAKTLESFAAPAQSYRTKRAAKSTYFVVNGYLGAGGGSENANGGHSRYLGVAAPVGLEVGWGNRGNGNWSLGVMAQLIDVGALASYRMSASEEDLESEPEVGFAQVFSPGGYVVFGIPRVPLTFGIGGNVAPQLRKVSGTEERKNASRFALMLAVDIPIFVVK
jgi:hypothetical protein